MFVTIEGGEGSGKSTLARALATALAQRQPKPVHVTRNPGGINETLPLRQLIVVGRAGRWDALTEALLLFADRRHHWYSDLAPRLERGELVICDRFFDSTDVYQGVGRGADAGSLQALRRLAIPDAVPDLTLVIDIDPALGIQRAVGRGGNELRYESFDLGFHQRLRQGYLDLAAREARCRLLNGSLPEDQLRDQALAAVLSVLRA